MADDTKKTDAKLVPESNGEPKTQPISLAKRKLLQTQFEKGSSLSGKGEFDYANEMFTCCVAADPGNLIYTQNFLGNLMRKYNNNKKGGKLSGMWSARAKAGMKKCRMKKDWLGVIRSGLDCLKYNPWDSVALTDVATACGELDHDDCRVEYLRVALLANPTDVDLNRAAALAYEDVADYDNAIRCWERIAKQRPNDDEPRRTISQLTVQKTIHKGGYEEAESSIDVSVEKKAADLRKGEDDVTPEVKLRREIRRKPEEVTNYIALSDFYWKHEDFDGAEKVMQEAVEATGSVRAREHLEDVQLGRERRALAIAEKKAVAERTEKAVELYKRLKIELNNRELEVYGARCERYPGNFSLKYEFGLRLERAGKFKEAIAQFQEARNEPKKVAAANFELGNCFYHLRKYDLALSSYQAAVDGGGLWDEEVKKSALYRAGKIARALENLDLALKCFTQLAGMEYNYKDVAELLDETRKAKVKAAN